MSFVELPLCERLDGGSLGDYDCRPQPDVPLPRGENPLVVDLSLGVPGARVDCPCRQFLGRDVAEFCETVTPRFRKGRVEAESSELP